MDLAISSVFEFYKRNPGKLRLTETCLIRPVAIKFEKILTEFYTGIQHIRNTKFAMHFNIIRIQTINSEVSYPIMLRMCVYYHKSTNFRLMI